MDSHSVKDVVHVLGCTGLSVLLLAVCWSSLILENMAQTPLGWEHNITNHLHQPITERRRTAGKKPLTGTCVSLDI